MCTVQKSRGSLNLGIKGQDHQGEPVGGIKMPLVIIYAGRPRPRRYCVAGPRSPKRGTAPQFLAYIYCGQTAGRIKMSLGTDLGLGPGDIVLDGDPGPPKGHNPPIFGPCLVWPNGRPSQLMLSTCEAHVPRPFAGHDQICHARVFLPNCRLDSYIMSPLRGEISPQ